MTSEGVCVQEARRSCFAIYVDCRDAGQRSIGSNNKVAQHALRRTNGLQRSVLEGVYEGECCVMLQGPKAVVDEREMHLDLQCSVRQFKAIQ